nr:hypothetical protein L203_04673 [Cryptococcus depauperatus CBS 7841]
MADLKAIKKYAAQHDLFNRLHSIAADEEFVKAVATGWYGNRFLIVPNQRCGTWYCDPLASRIKRNSNAYAYFKSTDGHMSHWDFNFRRSNLVFASYAEEKGGLILVDSTRRGKRMPDGLSKTVPIWCAVINIAISIRQKPLENWDTNIYLSPQTVSPTEKSQIQARLQNWAELLERSTLLLPPLKKPLRPFFIHPSTSSPPFIAENPGFTPIICLSASRWVNEGGEEIPSVTKVGERKVGFIYIPGGGDDDELWAHRLTPSLFHRYKKELLATERDKLTLLVDHIVLSGTRQHQPPLADCVLHSGPVDVPSPGSRLALNIGPSLGEILPRNHELSLRIEVVEVDKIQKDTPFLNTEGEHKVLSLPSAKSHGKAFTRALEELVNYVKEVDKDEKTIMVVLESGRMTRSKEISVNEDGKEANVPSKLHSKYSVVDSSARKAIIPLALTLLCAIPSLSGSSEGSEDFKPITKGKVTNVLHALITLWPDGNPPRAALKRVNEFLIGERRE